MARSTILAALCAAATMAMVMPAVLCDAAGPPPACGNPQADVATATTSDAAAGPVVRVAAEAAVDAAPRLAADAIAGALSGPGVIGRMLDARGDPASGRRIELHADAGGQRLVLPGRIDAAGRFAVPVPAFATGRSVRQGRVVLRDGRLDLAWTGIGPMVLPHTGTVDLGDRHVHEAPLLAAGRVAFRDGSAAACEIVLYATAAEVRSGLAIGRVRTAADGRFALRSAFAGEEVWLGVRCGGAIVLPPRPVAVGSDCLDLELPPLRRLVGRVVLPAAPRSLPPAVWPQVRCPSGGSLEPAIQLQPMRPRLTSSCELELSCAHVPDSATELSVHLPGLSAPVATTALVAASMQSDPQIEVLLDLAAELRWLAVQDRLHAAHAPLRFGEHAAALELGRIGGQSGFFWPWAQPLPRCVDRCGAEVPYAVIDGVLHLLPRRAARREIEVRLGPAPPLPAGVYYRVQWCWLDGGLSAETTIEPWRPVRLAARPELGQVARLVLALPGTGNRPELATLLLDASTWQLEFAPDPQRIAAALAVAMR